MIFFKLKEKGSIQDTIGYSQRRIVDCLRWWESSGLRDGHYKQSLDPNNILQIPPHWVVVSTCLTSGQMFIPCYCINSGYYSSD